MFRTACYCLLTFATAACTPALGLDLSDRVDALAKPLVEDEIVVGMVVGIVNGDEVQILTYGETKKGSKTKPTADSVYEIGSVTKVFTGILLADTVRQEKVALDDPLQRFVAEGVKVPEVDDQPITLRHLATHTSGLPRMPGNFRPKDPTQPYVDYDRKKLFAFLSEVKPARGPGKHEYSNYAMGILGETLGDVWDDNYEDALTARVLKPLKLNDTRITLNDAMRKRMVPGYNANLKEEPAWDFDAFAGAGAIRSTARDMVKFMQANLRDDDSAIAVALRDAHGKQPVPEQGQAMALGWHIAGDGITRWHNGMTGGYHSWLAVIPDHDIGVVVLANTATMRVSTFGEQVTRIALGAEVEPPQRRKEIDLAAEVLKKYVGVYPLAPQFKLTVTLEEGKLMVQATGQPKIQVYAESPTKFFYKVVDAQITFVERDDGTIEKLILHQNGRNLEAPRQKQ